MIAVAADSAWLRSAIEQRYEDFTSDVSRPGRSLGWLFLDKLFPVRIRLADSDRDTMDSYVDEVLELTSRTNTEGDVQASLAPGDGRPDEDHERERRIADVRDLESLDAKERAIEAAPAEQRPQLRVVAAATSFTPSTLRHEAHFLSNYLTQIATIRNPRTIKRFRNAYILNRFAYDGKPDADTIVRWTLVEVQWPDLAEMLRSNPDIMTTAAPPVVHDATLQLLNHPDVGDALRGVTPAKLRQMLRMAGRGTSLDEPGR